MLRMRSSTHNPAIRQKDMRTVHEAGMVMCRMALLLCWESFQQNRCLQEAFSECFRVSRGVLGAGVSVAADSRERGVRWRT